MLLAVVLCPPAAFCLLLFTGKARLLRFEAPKGAFLIAAPAANLHPLNPLKLLNPLNPHAEGVSNVKRSRLAAPFDYSILNR